MLHAFLHSPMTFHIQCYYCQFTFHLQWKYWTKSDFFASHLTSGIQVMRHCPAHHIWFFFWFFPIFCMHLRIVQCLTPTSSAKSNVDWIKVIIMKIICKLSLPNYYGLKLHIFSRKNSPFLIVYLPVMISVYQ